MALTLYDKLTPSGDFPLVKAADVEMSDGTRFDEFLDGKEAEILDLGTRVYALELKDAQFEFAAETAFRQVEELSNRVTTLEESDSLSYPVQDGGVDLQPEQYYTFGEVDSLYVNLVEVDDGKVHEHCFEFIPTEDFEGLTITPEPKWATEPQYPAGKTCQVSILRGIGVMVCA